MLLPTSPTRQKLSDVFGFPVPMAFTELFEILYAINSDKQSVDELFTTVFDYDLAAGDIRYQQTPPELFPFISTGVDGEHYGYVIHVPDIQPSDYPVASLCPMDRGGVGFTGETTREAVENILSFRLRYNSVEDIPSEFWRFCEAYGIHPDVEKATRRYTPEGNHRLVLPTVPQGWRYFPTTDGIGVLAPRDAFSSVDHSPDGLETAEMHSQAVAALRAGYPGTALYYLREAYWWEWTGDPAFVREICWQLIATYQALRRPLLMLEVERRISEFYTEHGEVG